MKITYLIGLVLFLFCSCNESGVNSLPSIDEMFCNKPWIIESAFIEPEYDFNGDGIKSGDIFDQMPNCERDNIYFWMNDRTVEYSEGETRCDAEADQIISSGTWFFNDTKTHYTEKFYDGNTLVLERDVFIHSLTTTYLIASFEFERDSVLYKLTFKYKHP